MTEWLKLPQKIASGHSNIASHTFSHAGDGEFQGPGTLRTLVTPTKVSMLGPGFYSFQQGKHCWKIPMEMGEGQAKEHRGHPGPGRTVLCLLNLGTAAFSSENLVRFRIVSMGDIASRATYRKTMLRNRKQHLQGHWHRKVPWRQNSQHFHSNRFCSNAYSTEFCSYAETPR